MELEFYTPSSIVARASIQEVVIPGVKGELGVLPGHTELITELGEGRLVYRDTSGKDHTYQVRGGYAEITHKSVIVLAEEIFAS